MKQTHFVCKSRTLSCTDFELTILLVSLNTKMTANEVEYVRETQSQRQGESPNNISSRLQWVLHFNKEDNVSLF